MPIKITGGIDLDGECQHQKKPIVGVEPRWHHVHVGDTIAGHHGDSAGDRPWRNKPKIFGHRDDKQGYGKHHGNQQALPALVELEGAGIGFAIVGIGAIFGNNHTITGFFDGGNQ